MSTLSSLERATATSIEKWTNLSSSWAGVIAFFFTILPRRFYSQKQNYPDDPDAIEAAYLHILTDELCSADSNYKKSLVTLALINRPKKGLKMKKSKEKERPLVQEIQE